MYIKPKDVGYVANDFGLKQKRDCAVRAIANVGVYSYPLALSLLNRAGRRDNKGTPWHALDKVYKEAGAFNVTYYGKRMAKMSMEHAVTYRDKGMTLKTFLADNPKGRHVVIVRGHALAVVNGNTVDMFSSKAGMRVIASFTFAE
jgi:hypothetical protein